MDDFKRRSSDVRLDKIEDDISALNGKYDKLKEDIDKNGKTLRTIQSSIEPLNDISDGVKGLHVIGKLIVWLGAIIGSGALAWNFFKSGGS